MPKENLSLIQLLTLTINFLIGSSIVVGVGLQAKNDAWIALAAGTMAGFAIVWFYHKISDLVPEKNIYQIFEYVYGKKITILLSLLYVTYFVYLASRVVRDFIELISASIMPHTPIEFISLTLMLLMGYIIYLGIEVLARITEIFTPYILGFFVLLGIFLIASGTIDIQNIKPVLSGGVFPVAKVVFPSIITFPFGELIAFLIIFPAITKRNHSLKFSLIGVGIAGGLLTLSSLLTITTLGTDITQRSAFPLLSVARLVSVGEFIERMDSVVVFIMMLGILIKGAVFLFSATKGLEHIFNLPYRYFAVPLAMIVSLFSILVSVNFADHVEEGLTLVPKFLHLPFQFGVPGITMVIILWKKRKQIKKRKR
ncbi:GerAB/ArcD/ProY family transporter [Peribacillus deserti]|nr:endospore germination permease [Peribacillus deserti]